MHWSAVGEFLLLQGDPTRIYHFNYWTYVFTGFWEYRSKERWKTYLYEFYHSFVLFVYVFCIFSYLGDAVSVRHDLDKLSFNMSSNVLVLITVFKLTFLRRQMPDVNKILENLENNFNVKKQSVGDEEVFQNRARLILKFHGVLYGLLFVSFALRMVADITFGAKTYLVPLPFVNDSEEHYDIIYGQQAVVCLHFLVTVMAHDLFIYGIINRFIAHFEVLEKKLIAIGRLYCPLGGVKMERKARQMLRESIRHHQELLKEILNFTRIYGSSFLIQASAAIVITGIVAIKIISLSGQVTPLLIQQIITMGINLVNNLFLCSLGSGLTSKSTAAGEALYGIPWFEMKAEDRRIVSIVMRKLQAGVTLKGGGLVTINRRTYLKFLQISYNMIVFLRNLYKS